MNYDQQLLNELILRPTISEDLCALFNQQNDKDANYMAAFTVANPEDRPAFITKWEKVIADKRFTMNTILSANRILGSVLVYFVEDEPQLSYWIDKSYWGQGVATRAVELFLKDYSQRPLFSGAAMDNKGSISVLQKNGFRTIAIESGFANAREEEIEKIVMRLD